ncbi:MAG TPA: hypothetical protein VIS48_13485 [Candidatus Kryptonia bacterium]
MEPLYIDFSRRMKASKVRMIIYMLVGLCVIADGIYQIAGDRGPFHVSIGILLLIVGPLYLLLVWLSPKWKWYVKVDGSTIEYKLQIGKLRRYEWDGIKKVNVTDSGITIEVGDGKKEIIGLGTFGKKDRAPIREAISGFAKEKGVLAEG